MLAPISEGRRDKGSSFKKLATYLTKERDPETGEELLRGDPILSNGLLSLETAHIEMKATAAQNVLCKDPIYHYEITWPPGERPSRAQWHAAALKTLHDLGFMGHEYLIVPHDDKAHFHVHVMVNKVHPESYHAQTPYRDMYKLDKAMRELEHEQGWAEGVGLYRWDQKENRAVKTTREERRLHSERSERASGKAAELEHYRNEQSLQAYVKGRPAAELQMLLARQKVSWSDVHTMLHRHGLEIQRTEQGGYTIHAIESDLYIKASSGFRRAFAGRLNRAGTEAKLGLWQEPAPAERERAEMQGRYDGRSKRNPEVRAERQRQRESARAELKQRFDAYRINCRIQLGKVAASAQDRRKGLFEELRARKKQIRAQDLPWQEKRSQLSRLVAEHAVQSRRLTSEIKQQRLTSGPLNYQDWVMQQADAGDLAALAQLRGWRNRDQRTAKRRAKALAGPGGAIYLLPGAAVEDTAWELGLIGDAYRELQRSETITQAISHFTWKVDRRTGDVHYASSGTVVLVDQGKAISVFSNDEAAVVLALEMAIRKYGKTLSANGTDDWKRAVALVAARNSIAVEFTDLGMQNTVASEQQRSRKVAEHKKEFVALHESALRRPAGAPLMLPRRDTASHFLEFMMGNPAGPDLLKIMDSRLAVGEHRRQNIKGICDVEVARANTGENVYRIHSLPVSRDQLLDRLRSACAWVPSSLVADKQTHRTRTPDRTRTLVKDLGRGD